jgi:hypothetical protein
LIFRRHAEAALVRKKAHQKRRTLVMRGRVEQLIRYVLSIPKANPKEYSLVCGDKEYGWGRMEGLARKLEMNVRVTTSADLKSALIYRRATSEDDSI